VKSHILANIQDRVHETQGLLAMANPGNCYGRAQVFNNEK